MTPKDIKGADGFWCTARKVRASTVSPSSCAYVLAWGLLNPLRSIHSISNACAHAKWASIDTLAYQSQLWPQLYNYIGTCLFHRSTRPSTTSPGSPRGFQTSSTSSSGSPTRFLPLWRWYGASSYLQEQGTFDTTVITAMYTIIHDPVRATFITIVILNVRDCRPCAAGLRPHGWPAAVEPRQDRPVLHIAP